MDGRVATAVALVAALAPGSASAAPRGAIAPLRGHGGCVGPRGCDSGRALHRSRDVAVTPDGANVYVATQTGLAAFARSPRAGALSQLAGPAGCAASGGDSSCAPLRGIVLGEAVAVSPDGRNVYLTGFAQGDGAATAIFARDPATGTLAQLDGTAGCIVAAGAPAACATARRPGGSSVTVSPDGAHVYTGGPGGVGAFARDPATGALGELPGDAGCVDPAAADGCRQGRGMGHAGAYALAVTADGRNLYSAAEAVDEEDTPGVAVFDRDAASGALTQPGQPAACRLPGCHAVTGFSLSGLAASPDGRSVYVADAGDVTGMGDDIGGGLVILRRGPDGALAQPRGGAGCLRFAFSGFPDSCTRIRTLARAYGVAVSPDARSVYVVDAFGTHAAAGLPGSTIGAFARSRTGALRQLPRAFGCASRFGPCVRTRSIAAANGVTVSPDGRNVYVASDGGVTAFTRAR